MQTPDTAAGVVRAARDASDSRPMDWAARTGLAARGAVYLLMGILALLVAQGSRAQLDQKGALSQVLSQPFGGFIVALLALGFAAYSMWRLSEAAFGVVGEGRRKGPRLQSLARGLVYAFLCFTAIALLAGSRTPQSKQQQGYAATAMSLPAGRWAVGLAGLVVAGVGIFMVVEGIQLRFMRYFPADQVSGRPRSVVRVLGRVGTIARGLVFVLTGALVMYAAWAYEPAKAGGIDTAMKALQDAPFGDALLGLAALGLIVFGVYGFVEARYRRV
jgi:hypothetical protein